MYKIEFSKHAEAQFNKLPPNLRDRIFNVLDRVRLRPHHFVKGLIGCSYFSLRVEDYRLILDIQRDRLIIFVIELGHRRNIYKAYKL